MLEVGQKAPHMDEQPVFGLKVKIPVDPRKKLLVVFPGSRLNQIKNSINKLHSVREELDLKDINVVLIVDLDLEKARDLVAREHVLFPLITNKALFNSWGIESKRFNQQFAFLVSQDQIIKAEKFEVEKFLEI